MSRITTKVALLQVLLITLGYIGLGIVLKMCGYPHDPTVRWLPLAVFLRKHGLWLLVLSLFWLVFALAEERRTGLQLRFVTIGVGIGIPCVALLLFIYAALFPYTRPILYYFGPSHSSDTHR